MIWWHTLIRSEVIFNICLHFGNFYEMFIYRSRSMFFRCLLQSEHIMLRIFLLNLDYITNTIIFISFREKAVKYAPYLITTTKIHIALKIHGKFVKDHAQDAWATRATSQRILHISSSRDHWRLQMRKWVLKRMRVRYYELIGGIIMLNKWFWRLIFCLDMISFPELVCIYCCATDV